MFKKSLILVSIALLFALPAWANGPDTVCGWIGPVNCNDDTGHIEISNRHTQGEHSLNFVVHYVGEVPDSLPEGCADFKRCLGNIELPDTIKFDQARDNAVTFHGASMGLVITYMDTVWESGSWYVPTQDWQSFHDSWYLLSMYGGLVSPDTVKGHFPPAHVDTLKFRVRNYCFPPPDTGKTTASLFIDNIRFSYRGIDTLIDGMGDKTGTEETTPIYKQKLEVYPNPCRSAIEISYCLATSGHVFLEIYDITGSKIVTLEEIKPAGKYKKIWNMNDEKDKGLPTGIYFLRMTTDRDSISKKFVLLP